MPRASPRSLGQQWAIFQRLGIVAALGPCLLLALAGCDANEPSYPSATLAGKVTIVGQPVAKGTVLFMPLDADRGSGTSAEIVQGSYTAKRVPQGKVLVRFNVIQETGRMITSASSDQPQPERIDLVPERHRGGMEIVVTSDNPQWNFEL